MAVAGPDSFLIRDPKPEDEAAWRRLWAAYVAFYEAQVPDAVTAGTWARLLDPNSGMIGRLAERNGVVVGFTVSVIHPGSWTLQPICYLEDLFVDPRARGHGVGRALIDDLVALARECGWSRLYWHTKASNETARRLYDRYIEADDFVRYRMFFP
jgi:ribosomal protein S18 acetylase RimI-like enzyme